MNNEQAAEVVAERRILAIDVFRGVVMFFLIAEAAGIYDLISLLVLNGSIIHAIGLQFQHHPWQGLRLWDLGQSFFMFISGAAMYFSYSRRWRAGQAWKATLVQALRRSAVLFALGWAIYRIRPVEESPHVAFLYDVLPQIALAGLFAFLVLRLSVRIQVFLSIGLLAATELLYRGWSYLAHTAPFGPGANFGSAVDCMIFGSALKENWVVFNVIPLTAFMIWGALSGRWLGSDAARGRKLGALILFGFGCVLAGIALSPITPIIRRIATSSFVLVGGGACLLALALAFWLVDVVKVGKRVPVFLAIGSNPIFIYLFAQTGGADWLRRLGLPFAGLAAGHVTPWLVELVSAMVAQALMCGLSYALYGRRIHIRI